MQPLEGAKEIPVQAITYAFQNVRRRGRDAYALKVESKICVDARFVALGLGLNPRRRLFRKGPSWLLETLSNWAKKREAPVNGLGERGNPPQPKRRWIRGNTCLQNTYSTGAVCGAVEASAKEPRRRQMRENDCHEYVGEVEETPQGVAAAGIYNLSITGRADRVSIRLSGVGRQGETRA